MAKKTAELPIELADFPTSGDFETFLRQLCELKGIDHAGKTLVMHNVEGYGAHTQNKEYIIDGNTVKEGASLQPKLDVTPEVKKRGYYYNYSIHSLIEKGFAIFHLFVSLDDATVWGLDFRGIKISAPYHGESYMTLPAKWTWKKVNKLIARPNYKVVEQDNVVEAAMQQHKPYVYQWYYLNGLKLELRAVEVLMAPQIELLHKAGYALVDGIGYFDPSTVDRFNRLCKNGHDLNSIFTVSKPLYKTLKNEGSLEVWDAMRKMEKLADAKPQELQDMYDKIRDKQSLGFIEDILKRRHNDKRVFTWTQLSRYLERLDMFEAISRMEALPLLRDYLQMCEQLGIRPRIDSDSLKREHDIAARLSREQYDEAMKTQIIPACQKLQKLNYDERIFFIRAVNGYDDLMDEARQQHNCLASYAKGIASGNYKVYFMRQQSSPDKSLVTVQINNEGRIIQKYMAFNQPVTNKAMNDFLARWEKYIRNPATPV